MIQRHFQNIFFFFKNSFFQNYAHLKIKIFTSPANASPRKWIFFSNLTFYFDTLLSFYLSICPNFIFLNFSFFLILKNVFLNLMNFRGELSLPLQMVHRGSDFPCKWFIAEVTSPVNGSLRKWLPLGMVHRGSFLAVNGSLQDFDKK